MEDYGTRESGNDEEQERSQEMLLSCTDSVLQIDCIWNMREKI